MEKQINVIHFSTGHAGGAGIAARRLNSDLNFHGIDSKFITILNPNFNPNLNEFGISRSFIKKIMSKINSGFQKLIKTKYYFSTLSVNIINTKTILKLAPSTNTILHFHNWFNLINQNQLLKFANMGYKIVLTMHDERFYTGGCHYAFECEGFKFNCGICPQTKKYFNRMPRFALRKISSRLPKWNSSITFIAPSMWIKERSLSSSLLNKSQILFIPNTLSYNFEKQFNFERKSNRDSKYVLGVASMDKKAYIKGADIIENMEKIVKQNQSKFDIIYLSDELCKQNTEENFWNRIDFLLVLSRIDNSPNVIHEAKAIGIPIVATAVGGITELMNPDYDLLILDTDLCAEMILDKINDRIKSNFLDKKINMTTQFNAYRKDSALKHIQLYRSLLQ
jgi:glycosyltransferase involved in cell wall biosynthesis